MDHSSLLTAQRLIEISDLNTLYAGIINLSVGLIGNLLLVFVFLSIKAFRGNSSVLYLTFESISNIGYLLTMYIFRITKQTLGYDIVRVSLPWCKISTFISQCFGLCSLYSVCFLAIDQYLSTNHQMHWRQWSTPKLAKRFIGLTICFALLHNILFLIFTDIQPGLGCTVYNSPTRAYFFYFFFPILGIFLPVAITMSFSSLAYRNVRRIVRRQIPIVQRRLERQMTAMTLTRVVFLVICAGPFVAASFAALGISYAAENYLQIAILNLVISIFSSLLYFNFAVGFFFRSG